MQINNGNQANEFYLNALTNKAAETSKDDASQPQDQVSLSSPAKKLQKISATFFSSGAIASNDIPSLVQELYKGGFINESELSNLGFANPDNGDQSAKSEEALMLNQYLQENKDTLSEKRIASIEKLIKEL